MKGDAMNESDKPRRLGPLAVAAAALLGIGGGLVLALYSFIQLRTAWLDGVFVFGGRGRATWDVEYESEPLSYIVAMSALYPTAIVVGIALAIVSAVVLMRQRSAPRNGRRAR